MEKEENEQKEKGKNETDHRLGAGRRKPEPGAIGDFNKFVDLSNWNALQFMAHVDAQPLLERDSIVGHTLSTPSLIRTNRSRTFHYLIRFGPTLDSFSS